MAAEFIDILKEPELDIGHSKKVLFTSDHFHTWVHGDYPCPEMSLLHYLPCPLC